jgi:hypothetical protein
MYGDDSIGSEKIFFLAKEWFATETYIKKERAYFCRLKLLQENNFIVFEVPPNFFFMSRFGTSKT